MIQKVEIVLIKWIDSYGVNGTWSDINQILKDYKPCIIETIGYLYDKEEYVIIIPHITGEDFNGDIECCGAIAIPKVAIKKTTILKELSE